MTQAFRCSFANATLASSDSLCGAKSARPAPLETSCPSRSECTRQLKYAIAYSLSTSSFSSLSSSAAGTKISEPKGLVKYSIWSKCSSKCGLGHRTREASCHLAANVSVRLPMSSCDSVGIEKLKIKCLLANCSFKLVEKWTQVQK